MAKLSRRIFLRGLGGAVVAAPFLGSLFERTARAGFVAPKRTILMFTHYGHITNQWFPAKLDGELSAADLQPTTLAPLAPFASKLLMPRGIRSMNEWTSDNRGAGKGRGQGNDIHTQLVASALTCQPVTPNSNDPFSFNTATKLATPIGPSLDHVIAQQLSPEGTPLLLNVAGMTREDAMGNVSYVAAQTPFAATSAAQAFAKLTGLLGPTNADTRALARGKAVTDLIRDDLRTLARMDMSKADKDKLEAWMELTNSVGSMLVPLCSQHLADQLGASAPLNTNQGEGDVISRRVNDTMDNADLHAAIAVLTAACNVNPVIVLKYPSGFTYYGLGINTDSDTLAHRVGTSNMTGPCMEGVLDKLLTLDSYHAQKFANLVKMLNSIPEGEQTVLDSTVAVWLSDCSDGCARNLNNATIIQAGSGGGYFKTGKVIDLDPGSGATAEAMLGRSLDQCSPGTDMMVDAVNQATGTDPQYGNAPVNKYFCNIMNAMGLRADESGFAANGGPESEVTHFGYSDRTEDFCGGAGAIPDAKIHDPGAFDLLKA